MHNTASSLTASLSGKEEVERQLRAAVASGAATASPAAAAYVSYLEEARDFFRQEVAAGIRFASLLKVGGKGREGQGGAGRGREGQGGGEGGTEGRFLGYGRNHLVLGLI